MDGIELFFDSNVYDLDVIKKASYRFIDQFSVDISLGNDSKIICVISYPSSKSPESVDHMVSEFKKELLDQDLRKRIGIETEAVRNLILAHAFSKTSLVNE
jgi:His-Xaa-Ser system protein HxsD